MGSRQLDTFRRSHQFRSLRIVSALRLGVIAGMFAAIHVGATTHPCHANLCVGHRRDVNLAQIAPVSFDIISPRFHGKVLTETKPLAAASGA